jgi:hypothetical protein
LWINEYLNDFTANPQNTMSDYQRVPGNIRSFLATTARVWTDHTAELARQYAALCDETNQRLRRCADYLARGMGSAAVHLAECQPSLSQAVTWLQFPERAAWADFCVVNGMTAPAILETECLAELKATDDREKSLQPLLSRHRLLAIAKASSRVRLEIVRLLAAEDPNNPAWPSEILFLEKTRLGEIATESAKALANHDDATLEGLMKELTEQQWRQEAPEKIRTDLQRAIAERTASRAQAELPAVAEELLSTFQAEPSAPKLPDLAKKWTELAATPGISMDADLRAKIQPILELQIADERRKQELEEIKPYQQLFQSVESAANRQPKQKRGGVFTAMTGLFGLSKK